MKSKKLKEVIDESEYEVYQALMYELDSTLDRMRCVSSTDLSDAYEHEQFQKFWYKIKNEEVVVVSVTNNSDLYELSDDSTLVILMETLDLKRLIFDVQDRNKIINKILSA